VGRDVVNPLALFVVYGLVGLGLGLWILGHGARSWQTALSACAAIVVWPLWAPFALRRSTPESDARRPAERRVLRALASAREAVKGTPLNGLLSERDRASIVREVTRIARRLDLVEAELDSASTSLGQSTPGRARRLERLEELAHADRRALEELAELAEMLATELALARFGQGDGVESLVTELSARVEALSAS
jgi:hypothetical protein